MTQEEFKRAVDGFKSSPQRHYVIDGKQPNSLEELMKMAEKADFGAISSDEVGSGGSDKGGSVGSEKPSSDGLGGTGSGSSGDSGSDTGAKNKGKDKGKPKGKAGSEGTGSDGSVVAGSEKATSGSSVVAGSEKAGSGSSEGTGSEVTGSGSSDGASSDDSDDSSDSSSVNLGTLSYKELQALAATLGIDPVPTVQSELVSAIEAKQQGS